MKKSTVITILAFALGILILGAGFILLTDNNISRALFSTTTTAPEAPKEPEPMDLYNTDMSQYVTLGQYKDIVIETEQIEVSDEEIEMQINMILAIEKEYDEQKEGTITEKIIFNFDYKGYLLNEDGTKGEAFSGGAAVDQLAYIDGDIFYTLSSSQGVGTFIDGFAQGIINKNVGDSFDLPITFPDNYSADMAGKKTVFEIKINYIAAVKFTDEWVKEYSKEAQNTCDEYREYVRKTVNDIIKESNTALLWETIVENATVTIPQQQYDYVYYTYHSQIEEYAAYFGMTYEDFLKSGYVSYFMGLNVNSEESLVKFINDGLTYELVMLAVIQKENVQATDEEYAIMMETLVEQMGKTEEEVLQQYSEDFIKQQIVLNKIDKVIYDLNEFTLKTAE